MVGSDSREDAMRGQQVNFVAGGNVSFLRLRQVAEHPGAQLEIWDWDQGLQQSPGCPRNAKFVGMVGKQELLDLAVACMHMLNQKTLALELQRNLREATGNDNQD